MQAGVVEKPAPVEDVIREVSKIRTTVTDAVEEGVHSASQLIRHGRHAAEDAVEELKHTIKQRPFQAVGVAFAAGALVGGFLIWIGSRRQ
jgi:ElaB/YqjD/DUF883 family membrane-anchored ribosome-binding protein